MTGFQAMKATAGDLNELQAMTADDHDPIDWKDSTESTSHSLAEEHAAKRGTFTGFGRPVSDFGCKASGKAKMGTERANKSTLTQRKLATATSSEQPSSSTTTTTSQWLGSGQ